MASRGTAVDASGAAFFTACEAVSTTAWGTAQVAAAAKNEAMESVEGKGEEDEGEESEKNAVVMVVMVGWSVVVVAVERVVVLMEGRDLGNFGNLWYFGDLGDLRYIGDFGDFGNFWDVEKPQRLNKIRSQWWQGRRKWYGRRRRRWWSGW